MLTMIRSLGFICLLLALSTMAQTPPVVDSEGQPLTRGVKYYVDPAVADIAGSLTLLTRNGSCPSYVGRVTITRGRPFTGPQNLTGIPVIFTPTNPRDTIITESTEFTVAFAASVSCVGSTTWSIGEEDPETRSRLIVIGGQPTSFRIGSMNMFIWCPRCLKMPRCDRRRCGVAGILQQNDTGFLAVRGPTFSNFRFRRA